MNEKQLERMQIRAERYATALEKAIYEDIGIGKYTGFDICVAVEKTVDRFLAKLPNNLSFDYLDKVCHWIDLIINKDNGSCEACFSPTSFNIEVGGLDATHYYKNGYDRCRFENFNADVAGMIAGCFCERFDDTDWDGNNHWLLYYKPMPFWEFKKDLKWELRSALNHFVDCYENNKDYYFNDKTVCLNGEMPIFELYDLIVAYKADDEKSYKMLFDDLMNKGVFEFVDDVFFNKARDWYSIYEDGFYKKND